MISLLITSRPFAANPIGPGPVIVPTEANLNSERAYKQQLDAAPQKPRLPHNVRAIEYNISVHPYFPAPDVVYPPERNFTFDGRLRFRFEALEDMDYIQLDALHIELSEIYGYDESGEKIRLTYVTYDSKFMRFTVAPLLGFDAGKQYVIEMVYRGLINNYMDAGLFYTTFIDKKGDRHYIIATHMEGSGFGAKSVFPCLDDPGFKAHFQITLSYPKSYVPLANTREYYGSTIGNGYLQVEFPRSILMSTYLVAFATGEFVSKEAYTPDNVLVRSWAWIGMEDYLQFAADTSAQCLYKMSQFANLSFPMDKTDQLGLPEFKAGAMENYGLIIYKYQYIAYNPKVHSTFNKFSAIRVMCHELSHQWFGDTVTAMWWDDLFLHEGFAAYWEYFAPLMVFPTQNTFLTTYFVSDNEETAFRSDADPALSHPIVYKDGPAFDDMTYNKGSSVIRMLRSVLGEDVFRTGLRRYIAKYKFQNANHTLLFDELTSAANDNNIVDWCKRLLNVNAFMDPWMLQQNFPLVSVVHSGNTETLVQAPFSDISTLPSSVYNYSWPIPIFYQTDPQSSHTEKAWLPPASEASCQSTGTTYPAGKYQLLNVDTLTFARVRYDDDSFQAILSALGTTNNISISSKVRLINDEVVYAKEKSQNGHPHPYENLLALMNLILPNSHPHPAIFETVHKTVDLLEGLLTSEKQTALYSQFVKKTIGPLCRQLGWETSDSWDQNIARERILPYCVRYNIQQDDKTPFVKIAMDYYGKLVGACGSYHNGTDSCNPLHPDIRKAVYCAAAMQNHQTIFHQLITFYVNQYQTDIYFYQEYQALLYGLSCAPNEKNLTSVIHHIANSNLVGSTELFYMATNPIAFQTFYDYLSASKNLQLVLKANLLDGYLNAMTFNVFDQARQTTLNQLFQNSISLLNADQQKTFKTYVDRTDEQVAWANKHSKDIIRWMNDNIIKKEGQVIWNKRLPAGAAKPSAYSLHIKPYLPGSPDMDPTQNFTFEATSSINFTLSYASNELTINAYRMIFKKIIVLDTNGAFLDVDLSRISYDFDNAMITITLPKVLPAHVEQFVKFEYIGFIYEIPHEGPDTNTFYSRIDGHKSWIFNTDFEGAPGLRSMIPCFDEPNYKAKWTITVTHMKDMTAISNMPATSISVPNSNIPWTTTTFQSTPDMSSYMVAICVGHFNSIQTVTKGGVLVRVFTWPGMEIHGETALKTAAGALDFFGEYFELPYQLPKLDIMALPEYTNFADAMENMGLVIGVYNDILVDTEYATTTEIMNAVHTVAHEVTHQWFGDMVTLEWWSYVFLNEGFAEHWFINAMNATYPEQAEAISYEKYFLTQKGLRYDTIPSIWSPIVVNTTSSYDPFGPETYQKGSAMLTHISTILGDEVLRKGIANYVKAHLFGNTQIGDLFESLTAEAQKEGLTDWANPPRPLNVTEAVEAYFYQIGYPVVKLSADSTQKTVSFSQSSFVDPSLMPPSTVYNYEWRVPMISDNPSGIGITWLLDQPLQKELCPSKWQIENFQGKGFFRVWYDGVTWAPILEQLKKDPSAIDPVTRASLMDDTYNLAERGSIDISQVLDLSLYLQNENTFAAWKVFEPLATKLRQLFKFFPENAKLLKHLSTISAHQQQNAMWTKTGNWAKDEFSALLNQFACQVGVTNCLQTASALFKNFTTVCQYSTTGTSSCSPVSPDNRRTMYCSGLAQDSSAFDLIYKLYHWFIDHNRYFQKDTANLLSALGCVADKSSRDRLVRDALSLKLNYQILYFIAENDASGTYLLDFLNANPTEVYDSPLDLSAYVTAMITGWSTEDQISELIHLGLDFNLSQHQRDVFTKAAASVQLNQYWLKRHGDSIKSWLNKHY
ncbi:hypothetical protein QR680_004590 [Steinernema hermaphroditum]|uniref:Aminopeptidase n=1 Tax=Steinernema hermaphroditum TaxID=289476 RepID=A0AA39LTX5_9BILA|nr:hypothetical protein QR680_004590 [Steinernema hermaphroditum]